jgi:hypothetical protein
MFLKKIFMKKVHIFVRHIHIYNPLPKARPEWFLIENCFRNLVGTLSDKKLPLNVHLTVMFDGNDTSYNDDFLSSFMKSHESDSPVKINVIQFQGGSDGKAFHHTIDHVLNENYSDDDWIYLLENDYLHVTNWVSKLADLLNHQKNIDYISLYDHYDKYLYSDYDNLQSKVLFCGSHHWRTTPSTCATFLVTAKTLREDAEIIKTAGGDHDFFTALAKIKSRKLLSPIPGLSTHCMKDFLSPGIDWEKISNSAKLNY